MMKISIKITILLLFGSCTLLFAQVDRSKKPEAGPAPEINFGEPDKFTMDNGLQVIVVEDHKLPIVSFSLIIDRDQILEKEKVGYVEMAGQMLRRGTTNRDKDQIDQEVDFIGASLSPSSNSIYASSLSKHTEKLLELMTDILYNPTFPEEELDKIKKQVRSSLAAQKEDPQSIANNVSSVLVYGKDHPYGEVQKEEHVDNITVEDLKTYYQNYFKPNISYLAIVGDIDLKSAKQLTQQFFAQWEKGEVPDHTYQTPEPPSSLQVSIVDRPNSVQTVLDITYPLDVKPGTREWVKANVTNQILGGSSSARLFKNIREDKGYTYGAYSSISPDELIGVFSATASVRNEVTDSAVHEFLHEMEKIRKENVTQEELSLAQNVISGNFIRALEDPQTIATFAINTERYNMPADYFKNYIKNIQSVTLSDVQEASEQFILPEHTYVVAVGKGSDISEGLSRFGEMAYYNMYGNKVEASSSEMPADLTAEKVFENYIQAIGGSEELNDIKNITIEMNASIPQGELSISSIREKPQKLVSEITMGTMAIQKTVFNGEAGYTVQMGQKNPLNEQQVADYKVQALMFPELHYPGLDNVKCKLTEIRKVDEAEAYVIEIELPSGQKTFHMYDTDSFLKVREETPVSTPQGEMTQTVMFDNYQEVEGIKFPFQTTINAGPQVIKAEVSEIEMNTDIAAEVFSVE